MSAVIGSLRADLSASVAQFQSDMGACADAVKKFSREAKKVAREIEDVGKSMSIALTLPLVALGTEAVKRSTQAATALAELNAVIKSTGNASGKTASQLAATSKELRNISTFQDDDILKGVTTNLLRFGNISGSVFEQAQKEILNLSAALGGDLQSNTIKVGRALNDPIAGVNALTRIGVQFTDQQKAQIKAMVQAGQGAKAQAVILQALETRYGGAAQALRDATPTAALMNAWDDFTEAVGDHLVPALRAVSAVVVDVLAAFNRLSPEVQKLVVIGAAVVAAVGPILTIFGGMVRFIATLAPLLVQLVGFLAGLAGAAADAGLALVGLAGPFAIAAAAVAALVALIWPFREVVIKALSDVWDAAQAFLGPAWGHLVGAVQGALQAFGDALAALWAGPVGDFFRVLGKALADLAAFLIRIFGGVLVGALTALMDMITLDLTLLAGGLHMIIDILTGQWSKAWADAVKTASDAMKIITGKATAVPARAAAPLAAVPAAPAVAGPLARGPAANFNLGNEADVKKLQAATKEFGNSLESMNRRISQGLAGLTLPKATAEAQALNEQIDAYMTKAKEAGVNTGVFDAKIKALRDRIESLKTAGLQKEADEFAQAVNADVLAVDKFAKGSLPPLQERLQAVDDQYGQLKKKIEDEISQNEVLASVNDDAAKAMERLRAQLAALEDAHGKAAEAATRQYDAEVLLNRLQSARNNLDTSNAIEDLRQARGEGSPISSAQAKLQATGRDLARQQLDSQIKLKDLQAQRDEAQARGDDEQTKNLNSEIALQQQLYDLVSTTTAQQLDGAQRLDDAFRSFTDDLTGSLSDMIANWNFDLKGLGSVFRKLISDLMSSVLDPVTSALGGALKTGVSSIGSSIGGAFAGMFADGGSLNPGQWGIAGENGPEPIFAGRGGMTVYPNKGGAQLAGAGRDGMVRVVLETSPMLDAHIVDTSGKVAGEVVKSYDRKVLPGRVHGIVKKPKVQ